MIVGELWSLLNPTVGEVRSYQNLILIAPKGQRCIAKSFEGFTVATLDSGHSTYQARVKDYTVEEHSAFRLVFEQFNRRD